MKVLVADDDLVTRTVLGRLLPEWGYEVQFASDGGEAREALARSDAPRLVLLDWMMPVLSGVELCRLLKGPGALRYTYTILLTGRSERNDVIHGLDAGADDFVSKPADPDLLRSRLAVGARMLSYDDAMAEQNALLTRYASEMEALAEARARQLVHADRMATLGQMSAGIAHEVNNPMCFISGNVQLLQMFWNEIEPCLLSAIAGGSDRAEKLKFIVEEGPKALKDMSGGVARITRYVQGMKAFARQGEGERVSCNVNECVQQAVELTHNALKRHVKVELDLAEPLPQISACTHQVEQVIVNLMINAGDAIGPPGTGVVRVSSRALEQGVRITVEDTGPGIPPEFLEQIWQPFFTTKPEAKGTGLGLSISQRIVQDHRGLLTAENRPEGGARFLLELPLS